MIILSHVSKTFSGSAHEEFSTYDPNPAGLGTGISGQDNGNPGCVGKPENWIRSRITRCDAKPRWPPPSPAGEGFDLKWLVAGL